LGANVFHLFYYLSTFRRFGSCPYNPTNHVDLLMPGLDFGEEVHWLVKNFSLGQGNDWYDKQDGNNMGKKCLELEFSKGHVDCPRV
jgi:hypothetical protein